MSLSAFPYPGGKTPYWKEIVQFFPDHRRYIEPFGGSAAVLLNKPRSYVEVYNDLDDDIVQFFRVIREQREELTEWLRQVPYSEQLHDEWQTAFLEGHRPDDPIERAGRWFYLRYTTYGGSTGRRAGFKRPGKRNEARSFRGSTESLDRIVYRLQEVTIACEHYVDIIARYDSHESLFYLDPPYVNVGQRYYRVSPDFDHGQLVDALSEVDGYWICSYGTLPDGLEEIATTVKDFDAQYSLPNSTKEKRKERTEHLVMNFDPHDEEPFRGPQTGLARFRVGEEVRE